jgi:glutathione S-transferase
MAGDRHVTFYHGPKSRSSTTFTLLEELKADYEIKLLNIRTQEQRQPAYLAVNPMGKVPAIVHKGALVTEQGAVFLYLGDLYADSGLVPQMGDPLRGPYLRWIVYHGSSYEPAIVDRAQKHTGASRMLLPYGDFDTMFNTLVTQLSQGPYILGEKFTTADVLWSLALASGIKSGACPSAPVIEAYIARCTARDAFKKVVQRDNEYADAYKKAAAAAG